MRSEENDGPLLWDFIRRRINPTTTVGASKLKDEIESKTASAFGNDIVQYNTWFEDTRDKIFKEEGDGYNEYLRSMFRAYMTCDDEEFVDAIKDERRKWMQGKLGPKYTYRDLMDLGRLTFNNLVDEGSWSTKPPKAKDAEKNYLALATQLMTQMAAMKSDTKDSSSFTPKGSANTDGPRTYLPWRFENPDNKATKDIRGSTMKWCKNDCHDQPMWCGRRNCMNRSDYSKEWQKKNGKKELNADNGGASNDEFKIALAAICSPEDFAALQEQFSQIKD